MTSQESMTLRPISDWQVQVLRLTVFYRPGAQFDISGWWAKLTGDQPETETEKPKESTIIQEGSFKDGRLTLVKAPSIIDLRLQLPEKIIDLSSGLPTIGSFEQQEPDFVKISNKLLELDSLPPINRVAFGSVVILPMESHVQAYKELAAYIKTVKIDADNSRDFLYRINRRRPSQIKAEGLTINRLNKWSVVGFQTGVFPPLAAGASLVTSPPKYACHLELDISTCQESQDNLPKKELFPILEELVSMAKEIITKGDIE